MLWKKARRQETGGRGRRKLRAWICQAARSAFGRHDSWRTNAGRAIYLHFGEQVRRALPADVAKRARDAGRSMSVEEAFEHALAMLPRRELLVP